jgi:hypothetical protein
MPEPHGTRVTKYLTFWERRGGGAIADVRTVAPEASVIRTCTALAATMPSTNAIGHAVRLVKGPNPKRKDGASGRLSTLPQVGEWGGAAVVNGKLTEI